jgi:hypothetical protein
VLALADLEPVRVELLERLAGHEHLAGAGLLGHAGGDVDVDAEIVAAQPARAAHVQAGTQARAVALGTELADPLAGVEHGLEGPLGLVEHRHRSVAQPLDDLAAVLLDRRLEGLPHVAQQVECGIVAGLERPVRERGEVSEGDRQLSLAAATPLRFGDSLPDLEGAEARLTQEPRPRGGQLGEPPPDYVRLLSARRREGIAEAAVARKELASELGRGEDLGVAVEAARRCGDPARRSPHATRGAAFLAHTPDLDRRRASLDEREGYIGCERVRGGGGGRVGRTRSRVRTPTRTPHLCVAVTRPALFRHSRLSSWPCPHRRRTPPPQRSSFST